MNLKASCVNLKSTGLGNMMDRTSSPFAVANPTKVNEYRSISMEAPTLQQFLDLIYVVPLLFPQIQNISETKSPTCPQYNGLDLLAAIVTSLYDVSSTEEHVTRMFLQVKH